MRGSRRRWRRPITTPTIPTIPSAPSLPTTGAIPATSAALSSRMRPACWCGGAACPTASDPVRSALHRARGEPAHHVLVEIDVDEPHGQRAQAVVRDEDQGVEELQGLDLDSAGCPTHHRAA